MPIVSAADDVDDEDAEVDDEVEVEVDDDDDQCYLFVCTVGSFSIKVLTWTFSTLLLLG